MRHRILRGFAYCLAVAIYLVVMVFTFAGCASPTSPSAVPASGPTLTAAPVPTGGQTPAVTGDSIVWGGPYKDAKGNPCHGHGQMPCRGGDYKGPRQAWGD